MKERWEKLFKDYLKGFVKSFGREPSKEERQTIRKMTSASLAFILACEKSMEE